MKPITLWYPGSKFLFDLGAHTLVQVDFSGTAPLFATSYVPLPTFTVNCLITPLPALSSLLSHSHLESLPPTISFRLQFFLLLLLHWLLLKSFLLSRLATHLVPLWLSPFVSLVSNPLLGLSFNWIPFRLLNPIWLPIWPSYCLHQPLAILTLVCLHSFYLCYSNFHSHWFWTEHWYTSINEIHHLKYLSLFWWDQK